MNTPTPEQLQDAAIWLSQQNYQKEQGEQEYMMYFDVDIPIMLTAYANHVLNNHEGFQSNAELKRKLAALQEKVDYWVEHWNLRDVQATKLQQQLTASQEQNTNLLGKLATTEQNLAISQERVKELEKHLDTLNAKLDDVAKKLRNIY